MVFGRQDDGRKRNNPQRWQASVGRLDEGGIQMSLKEECKPSRRAGQTRITIEDRIRRVPIDRLKTPPLQHATYGREVTRVIELAKRIEKFGVEPLVITEDDFVASGNTRLAACKLLGHTKVPIRRAKLTSADPRFPEFFVALNDQRVKSPAQVIREVILSTSVDPDEAYKDLLDLRRQRADEAVRGVTALDLGDRRRRKRISHMKQPMLDAVQGVLAAYRSMWPLSDRHVHYGLLNKPPLRNSQDPSSTYHNDRNSYQDLCNILTRARLEGLIDWAAISDETRPFVSSYCFSGVGPFLRGELDGFLRYYRRDLIQSQPCHVEIVGEKLTVDGVIKPVADDYCIPYTIGRGYASLDPRHKMCRRFQKSGKEKLVVLFMSDMDPEGQDIAESFGRSMRDDFNIHSLTFVKVALTSEQVVELRLQPQFKAKVGSKRRKRFVERFGDDVFELEAVPPPRLQTMLRSAIESVLDMDLFRMEQRREREDAAELAKVQQGTAQTLTAILSAARSDTSDPD